MVVNKIARKSSKFKVVFMVTDFCWPPAPPQVPPMPFPLFADLRGAKTVAKDVRINRKPAFVYKASKSAKTYGDEVALPGRKGVPEIVDGDGWELGGWDSHESHCQGRFRDEALGVAHLAFGGPTSRGDRAHRFSRHRGVRPETLRRPCGDCGAVVT